MIFYLPARMVIIETHTEPFQEVTMSDSIAQGIRRLFVANQNPLWEQLWQASENHHGTRQGHHSEKPSSYDDAKTPRA